MGDCPTGEIALALEGVAREDREQPRAGGKLHSSAHSSDLTMRLRQTTSHNRFRAERSMAQSNNYTRGYVPPLNRNITNKRMYHSYYLVIGQWSLFIPKCSTYARIESIRWEHSADKYKSIWNRGTLLQLVARFQCLAIGKIMRCFDENGSEV